MSSATALVADLHKRVSLKIRMGDHKDKIVADMIRRYGEDLGEDEVRTEVLSIVEAYGDYELIQSVMRSKIVQEIDGRDCIILDPKFRTATKITQERLRQLLHRSVDLGTKTYTCKFAYDPYTTKQLYKDGSHIWHYNQYRPAFWQAETFYSDGQVPLVPYEEMPEIYRRFLLHLVDSDLASYEYIVDWLANALQRRNFCILTTIGSQGIGKGTLGSIMKMLVGEENYAETGNRILEERFNGQIKNKRIVYCDEVSIKSSKEEERLKALVNTQLEIEAKGKDAERSTNFASLYFSSNSLDAIKLTADDRRFSIVNLTERKLPEVMSIEEIRALTLPENIALLGRYLYFRKVDEHRMLRVFISSRTEEIRAASLTVWQDWFLDEYAVDHSGKTVKIEDISAVIEDKYGSRVRPGKKAFMELSRIYPDKLVVYRPKIGDKQVWAVKFPDRG